MEQAMYSRLNQRLVAFAVVSSTFGPLGIVVPVAHAQSAACTAFADADFRGEERRLAAGRSINNRTSKEKISSFRILRTCRVDAYQGADFQGASSRWERDVPFVGDNWKDMISSWKCTCALRID
jgi:hypothetical protein